ncbi:Uncharacterised protein [Mycobacteroides abscessus]|nr:Uncharacterised protein [Mycobacteroides abscessus]
MAPPNSLLVKMLRSSSDGPNVVIAGSALSAAICSSDSVPHSSTSASASTVESRSAARYAS